MNAVDHSEERHGRIFRESMCTTKMAMALLFYLNYEADGWPTSVFIRRPDAAK